ncbi:MAG: hypothetical protein ACRCZY_11645, partial [Phocaeicola sp.]
SDMTTRFNNGFSVFFNNAFRYTGTELSPENIKESKLPALWNYTFSNDPKKTESCYLFTKAGNEGDVPYTWGGLGSLKTAPRITWDDKEKKYAFTTNPRDGGLFFKFGSVVGIYSGKGCNRNLAEEYNSISFEFDRDIPYNINPETINSWETILEPAVSVDAAFHTLENVQKGLGDPCRLVGLDLAAIQEGREGVIIDNKQWRLPTSDEHTTLCKDYTQIGYEGINSPYGLVTGMEFTKGDETFFLPEVGRRQHPTGDIVKGFYISSTRNGNNIPYLNFYANYATAAYTAGNGIAYSVRCVAQEP